MFSYAAEKTESSNDKENVLELTNLEFNINGDIIDFDFARAFCTETRGSVTYEAEVGCFLCNPQQATDRCARVLSRRIDRVNPEEIY
ncbi:hypothetical protein [Winogradskyella sediminis]|uniref:hypothetical protein n=1 Tax=Winogradskyella sediminis TaxID=1382466 RepID=UPI003AA9CAC5